MAIDVQLICTSGDLQEGIHYVYDLPTHIVITSYDDNADNVACGATSFTVFDGADGSQVGTGTISNTALNFNVSSSGSWIGGSTIIPGWYQVCTNNADSSSSYILICPDNPTGSGGTNLVAGADLATTLHDVSFLGVDLAPWAPGTCNRDCYGIPAMIPSALVDNVAANPYFTTGDGVRPRDLWVAPSDQSTTSPTTTDYSTSAAGLKTAGTTGAVWELPTNEPENAGYDTDPPATDLIAAINAMHDAVHSQDSTARFMVFSSAGLDSRTPFSNYANIIAGLDFVPDFFSTHMENDIQNMADFVSLRQYFDQLKAISDASNHQPWWFTETGIQEGGFGVLSTHRGMRARVMFRMVAEQYGWWSEHCYDFPQNDHGASAGLQTYGIEGLPFGAPAGNIRPGWYGLHVLGEALRGTSLPTKLDFGDHVGNSNFIGSYYSGTLWDCVMTMTNGVLGASVILSVPTLTSGATVSYWDGWGRTHTVTVDSSKHITIPQTDLATFVFLPTGSSATVVDTDQGVIAMNSQTNKIAGSAVTKNSAGTTITLPRDSFSSIFSLVGTTVPYLGTAMPDTLATTGVTGTVNGFALRTTQPTFDAGDHAPDNAPSAPTAFNVKINGTTVFSYTNATAVTHSDRPSGDSDGAGGPCTGTEYWDQAWSWVQAITPVAVTGDIELEITDTSFGGTIADALHGSIVQQIVVSEFQVFAGGSTSASRSATANIWFGG